MYFVGNHVIRFCFSLLRLPKKLDIDIYFYLVTEIKEVGESSSKLEENFIFGYPACTLKLSLKSFLKFQKLISRASCTISMANMHDRKIQFTNLNLRYRGPCFQCLLNDFFCKVASIVPRFLD